MTVTKVSKKVSAVTDRHSSYVKTPFGTMPAENHQEAVQIAKDYIQRYK